MAPKPPGSKTATKVNNKNPKARKSATSGPSTIGKSKVHRPTKQIKTKPTAASQSAARAASKKRQRVYTDKELNLPTLNMITPAGVTQPARGKKKGKVFIDDRESMMTILALVNAQKEGQIESKIMRERQLEEVREARRKEAEKRKEGKREILEGKMAEVKRKKGSKAPAGRKEGGAKKGGGKGEGATDETSSKRKAQNAAKTKKRVSFA